MIVKGTNCSIVKKYLRKSGLSRGDQSTEFSNLTESVEIDENETKQYSPKNTSLNVYLKYILPCDLMRLVLSIVLFCALVLFIRQAKYMVIERCEISIVSSVNESISDQRYEYFESIFEERILRISESLQVSSKETYRLYTLSV